MPLVIAHRGSSLATAEQTLGAFRLAIEEGADALECDVRLTADHELVCLHDPTIDRTSNSVGAVTLRTLAELRELDWGSWMERDPAVTLHPDDRRLITLRELIELALDAGREIGLTIETKHPNQFGELVEEKVAQLLEEYGLAGPRRPGRPWVRVLSFSQAALRRMAILCPDVPTVLLIPYPVPVSLDQGSLPRGVDTVAFDMAVVKERPDLVRGHHDQDHEVFVWTVDEEADIRHCLQLEVEAIISNCPKLVLDLVGAGAQ